MKVRGVARLFAMVAFGASAPAVALQGTLQQQVESELAEARPGTRCGLVGAPEDGRELIPITPDGRFVPASNTKVLICPAACAPLTGLARRDAAGGAEVRLDWAGSRVPDVILMGQGDGRL